MQYTNNVMLASHIVPERVPAPSRLSHLRVLEAESIHVLREVAAEFRNPVLLYSIGKDSSVLLHLARKAFHPGRVPFPLLHIDTTWKFREMIQFRDNFCKKHDLDLRVYTNRKALEEGVNPFDYSSQKYTTIMKTQALLEALSRGDHDGAIGGARRDEERSRAKERVFSFRDRFGQWEPKHQRPELWNLYNARLDQREGMRIFPLSNWTELDVWLYIYVEQIPIVPLYFAAMRPVVERNGMLIMVDDDRMRLNPGETPVHRQVRFRTLGCYPLTAAMPSSATNLSAILDEMLQARHSERQGRLIDHDEDASMEIKKREGYF